MKREISFKGTIEKFPGKGGWTYVSVPTKYTEALKDYRLAWGMYPITACVGYTFWKTKLMMKKGGSFFIALKASIRKTEETKVGDKINVSFKLDL